MATVNRVDRANTSRLSAELLDRQPPRSLDAERGVIGGILLLSDVCDDVATIVKEDDFYDDAHRRLFGHLVAMHNEGRKIDVTLLAERLLAHSDMERIGGAAYLSEILRSVPTAAHAVYYAEIVRAKSTLRALIHTSTETLRDAYDESSDPRELLGRAEQRVFSILDDRGGGQFEKIDSVLTKSLDRMKARIDRKNEPGGIETGFRDFDTLTGGLHAGELVILAARPSMGKTAMALNIAEHVGLNVNVPVLFVSLEMSAIELADRMLCSLARVNGQRLRNGTISVDDQRQIVEKVNLLANAALFVDDSPNRTVTEVAAAARRLKRRDGLGLIAIDYLQLIEPDNQRDPRQEQVAKIARRLKGLARELEVPVLCLAQLNRQAEVSKDNRPRLSHLRESGAIEQDADVVMFVHREEYYASNDDDRQRLSGQAELIVAKQRNGPIGDVKLAWLKDFTRFESSTYQPYDEFKQFNGDAF
jgi:replicative DNA helicase